VVRGPEQGAAVRGRVERERRVEGDGADRLEERESEKNSRRLHAALKGGHLGTQ
jgi:hypothetical protein